MEKNELKPAGVFHYFDEICQVPRPSKKEEKMIAYLKQNRLGRATFLPLTSVTGKDNSKQDVFLKEKEQLSRQEEVVRRQIEKVSEQIDMQEEREKNYRCVADLVKRYGTSETLTEEFMREMVEKVIVYEDKRIEIVWKYREEFEELL